MKKRLGIYAGTFDPVHSGHIAFALQAIEAADLEAVYFLPERMPLSKQPEHFGHRVAMLRQAVRPHAALHVLELPDKHFKVKATLPKLAQQFPGMDLVLLIGSDSVALLQSWPYYDQLVKSVSFCVGLREGADENEVSRILKDAGVASDRHISIISYEPHVSSTKVRRAIREHRDVGGLLASVKKYARQEWLYLQ